MTLADHLLDVGISADYLARLSAVRPDIYIRISWGRLEAGYKGEEPTAWAGTEGLDPSSDDWRRLAQLISALSHREVKA